MSTETKVKLQATWRYVQYLIYDEISMISKFFLANMSQHISIGKMEEGEVPSVLSFGSISVILVSNFFQFLPVVCAPSEALYYPTTTIHKNQGESQISHAIDEEFTTVVTLREQMHIEDPVWHNFLQHLHLSFITEHHLMMLPNCQPTDFTSPAWKDACLVTPHHVIHELWNKAALCKHGKSAKQIILHMRYSKNKQKQCRQDLSDMVELMISIKVMVMLNAETDLDITNGACGTVTDILLSPDEPDIVDMDPLQGQTLPMVLVDITTPPTGGLSLFNLYVALSYSSG
ncbi:hypothetical protein J3A83DRAFT_4359100 [Scleroderma citrinum]